MPFGGRALVPHAQRGGDGCPAELHRRQLNAAERHLFLAVGRVAAEGMHSREREPRRRRERVRQDVADLRRRRCPAADVEQPARGDLYGSKPVESATLEVARLSPQGGGWGPGGRTSPPGSAELPVAARSRQARPAKA